MIVKSCWASFYVGMNNWTLHFRLFGIPVSIHPSVFIVLLVLGGGLTAQGAADLSMMLLFVVAGLLCLLCHELGHALVAKLGYGARPVIEIAWLGGVTQTDVAPPSRGLAILMSLAGPLATLVPGLVCLVILGAQLGSLGTALAVVGVGALPMDWGSALFGSLVTPEGMMRLETMQTSVLMFYVLTNMVGLFWCVLNLVPAVPLDGGHVCALLTRSPLTAARIGVVSAGVVAVLLGWYTQSVWNLLLFGWLAYYNYRVMQSLSR